jgi:hypothetical protein
MQRNQRVAAVAGLMAAAALGGCSGTGPDGSSGNGTVSIGLIDAPVRGVSEIWIDIKQINLKPTDGPPIQFPLDPSVRKDLLSLNIDNAETLLDAESIPAGHYDWVELELNADFDSVYDSYVTKDATNGQIELRVPSGTVRLVSGFTITADQETRFLIDWDARKGLVDPVGLPGYLLRPALRIVDQTEYGTLHGSVATERITTHPECTASDPDPDVGNVVYIFQGHDATPDDIDGSETEPFDPVATVDVEPGADGLYGYDTILSPGDYTVVFTCQGENDLPNEDSDDPMVDSPVTFSMPTNLDDGNVTIEGGADVEVDF